MCKRYLGDQFDIHGGAMDLSSRIIENEVANRTRSDCGNTRWHRCWVSRRVAQRRRAEKDEQIAREFRAHERALATLPGRGGPLSLLTNRLPQAVELHDNCARRRGQRASRARTTSSTHCVLSPQWWIRPGGPVAAKAFDAFLDDDLNTAGALGWLQTKVREASARGDRQSGSAAEHRVVERCLSVLGLPATAALSRLAVARSVVLGRRAARPTAALRGDGALDGAAARQFDPRVARGGAGEEELRDLRPVARRLAAAGVNVRDRKSGSERALMATDEERIYGFHAVDEALKAGETIRASASPSTEKRS